MKCTDTTGHFSPYSIDNEYSCVFAEMVLPTQKSVEQSLGLDGIGAYRI